MALATVALLASGCVAFADKAGGDFTVHLGSAETAILGDLTTAGDQVRFCPRFPFLPGREHRVMRGSVELGRFTPPREPESPAPRVVRISPSAEKVPANLLRFYVWFSAPTSAHVRLFRESDNTEITDAFLPVSEELWDPSRQRLTVFFHPGRIKRGLALHDQLGPPLIAGQRYRLVVNEFVHSFTAVEADRDAPDPRRWVIRAPRAGTREPLQISTDKLLDEPILTRAFSVDGIPGVTQVEGRSLRFTPDAAWPRGTHHIRIAKWLEDLAGNQPGRSFESASTAVDVNLAFEIR